MVRPAAAKKPDASVAKLRRVRDELVDKIERTMDGFKAHGKAAPDIKLSAKAKKVKALAAACEKDLAAMIEAFQEEKKAAARHISEIQRATVAANRAATSPGRDHMERLAEISERMRQIRSKYKG